MGAVDKALKIYAKGVVTAAKSYANMNDGVNDNYASSFIVSMLNTYIGILQQSQQNNTLSKINYSKYISQIEKIRDKFIEKYDVGSTFNQTNGVETDFDLIFSADSTVDYAYPTDGTDTLLVADQAEITVVGVSAE